MMWNLVNPVCSRKGRNPACRQEAASKIAVWATPFIRSNPTAKHTDGNVCVVSSQDNVEKSENPVWINCQDKDTMKSVKQTIVKVVNYNKRKWIETLQPKGMESDYNGCGDIIGNGQTVSGL